jgi:hypothetical protein
VRLRQGALASVIRPHAAGPSGWGPRSAVLEWVKKCPPDSFNVSSSPARSPGGLPRDRRSFAGPGSFSMTGWEAQVVERRSEKPCVGGSIPPPATAGRSRERAVMQKSALLARQARAW